MGVGRRIFFQNLLVILESGNWRVKKARPRGPRPHNLKKARWTDKAKTQPWWAWPTKREACPAWPKTNKTLTWVVRGNVSRPISHLESLLARRFQEISGRSYYYRALGKRKLGTIETGRGGTNSSSP